MSTIINNIHDQTPCITNTVQRARNVISESHYAFLDTLSISEASVADQSKAY